MYSGDIAAKLQLIESGVSPVSASAAIAADVTSAPSQRVAALVTQNLGGGQFSVLAGARTLQLALPPDTEVGQNLQLQQGPDGRWQAAQPAQPVLARVVENLGGGLFNAVIGGRTVQLALPPQTEIGQILQVRQTPGGQWIADDAAAANPSSTQTNMSQAGRLIDLVLQAATKSAAPPDDPVPLLASAPVPEAGALATLPRALAAALAAALSESGVFYESHLQQWNAGNLSLATLAREPQAQLGSNGTPRSLEPVSGTPSAPADTGNELAAAMPPNSAISASLTQAGVHTDSVPMIAQQLSTLETGTVNWRGELWPGQSLSWNIARDDGTADDSPGEKRGGKSETSMPVWRTRLSLSLPRLGAVTANLALRGNSVWVSLAAAEPSTQQQLGAGSADLAGAFGRTGLSVQTVAIE